MFNLLKPRPRKKYCLHPGFVRSKVDGQEHHVSIGDLLQLYRVDMEECVISIGDMVLRKDLIHLYPREDGDYESIKKLFKNPEKSTMRLIRP